MYFNIDLSKVPKSCGQTSVVYCSLRYLEKKVMDLEIRKINFKTSQTSYLEIQFHLKKRKSLVYKLT